MDTQLGTRIRKARLEREWSIRELSARSGVGRQHIKAYEKGEQVPHDFTLAKIARALEMDIAELEVAS